MVYRPTCHYAYHPCQDAVISSLEAIGSGIVPKKWKIVEKEITEGVDELGVLLYGHGKNAYWYGSQLSIEDTRKLVENQNATALQVCSAVLTVPLIKRHFSFDQMTIIDPDPEHLP